MSKGKYIKGDWDTVLVGDSVHLVHDNKEMVAELTVHSVNNYNIVSTMHQLYYNNLWRVTSIWREEPVIELPTLSGLYEMSCFPIDTGCSHYRLDHGNWVSNGVGLSPTDVQEMLKINGATLERWDSITKVARDITEQFEEWFNDINDSSFHDVLAYIRDDYGVTL